VNLSFINYGSTNIFEKRNKCQVLLIHASWSKHKTWGLLGALDDNDADHDVHLAKPKIFFKVVNDYQQRFRI